MIYANPNIVCLVHSAVAGNIAPENTSANTMWQYVLKGGTLGVDGHLIFRMKWRVARNATTKTVRILYGASTATTFALSGNVQALALKFVEGNRDATNAQISYLPVSTAWHSDSATGGTALTVDTTADVTLACTFQKGTADAAENELLSYSIYLVRGSNI